MAELTKIGHLKDYPRDLLREITLLQRIDSLLEDINIDPVKHFPVNADLGSNRRHGLFHASTVGSLTGKSLCGKYPMGCGRELYYGLIQEESEESWDPRTRRILDIGTLVHAQIQAYLSLIAKCSKGTETFVPEADINPTSNIIADRLDISGHTDGIYTIRSNGNFIRFGVEIKTINESGYKSTSGPHPEHLIQGTIYQKCLDLPIMLFLYYNKNDSMIAEFIHVFDPLRWEAIEKKLKLVQERASEHDPPEREVSWNCSRCKYKIVCKPPKIKYGANVFKR